MIRQYNKIAFLDYSSNPITLNNNKVDINLSFNPSKLIIVVSSIKYSNNPGWITTNLIPLPIENSIYEHDKNGFYYHRTGSGEYWKGLIESFDKNKITWSEKENVNTNSRGIGIFYIIAIE